MSGCALSIRSLSWRIDIVVEEMRVGGNDPVIRNGSCSTIVLYIDLMTLGLDIDIRVSMSTASRAEIVSNEIAGFSGSSYLEI